MPQATEEQRKRWNGPGDETALAFLKERGYTLRRDWLWDKPSQDHQPTEDEVSAICFLIDEWDMGGIYTSKE